jgi:hypothetical protein
VRDFNRGKNSDLAAIAVFSRVQSTGERLTVQLVHDVIGELGSHANPTAAYCQARQWIRDCESTKRLGRR